jgi:hypothetical protein
MTQDFLESLWNCLKLSYKHLMMIQQLTRSIKAIFQICPEFSENKHFWWPTSHSYNSQTIWPIAMKIWHKQDKKVIYNFVIDKIHSKHHFHHAISLTTETAPNSPYNWIIAQIIFHCIQTINFGHHQWYQQFKHIIIMLENIMVKPQTII